MTLKRQLALGALVLGTATWVTALILWLGLLAVSDRLQAAINSETRIQGYAGLSTQAATFLVVATEAAQTGLPADTRRERLDPVVDTLKRSFARLQQDVALAVREAQELGLDAQSRFGTQSLGLARMEAMLTSSMRGLSSDTTDRPRLQAHIDSFASGFDPLLSQAIQTEHRFRAAILSDITALRDRLTRTAFIIAIVTVLLLLAFYFGLVRPQFSRLDRLSQAARKIAQDDLAIDLPETRTDEIGQIYADTNRMARSLATRKAEVQRDGDRLNAIIAERTAELQNANKTLAEIDENRRRFFADVSHELRTPLTVILMEAQIGRSLDGPAGEAFATIESRAARLNRRIDDLLRIARSDSGQLALDLSTMPVPDLIEETRAEIRAEIDNAGMDLTITPPPDLTLTCDCNWIRQVLVGLLRNAIRHARAGQKVALSAHQDGNDVVFEITDNGPGIASDTQTQVFERFGQAGPSSNQGFGIGLALAAWVAREHKGQITLTSPVPQDTALGQAPGTKIAVRLPLEPR